MGTVIAFVPHRLETEQAPEYSRFPLNVVFGATKTVDGKETLWTALYEPAFSTYKKSEDGSSARMFYYNRWNREWHLAIVWKNIDGKEQYMAWKYSPRSDEPVFEVDGGADWDRFFTQLTLTGLVAGENCEITPLPENGR